MRTLSIRENRPLIGVSNPQTCFQTSNFQMEILFVILSALSFILLVILLIRSQTNKTPEVDLNAYVSVDLLKREQAYVAELKSNNEKLSAELMELNRMISAEKQAKVDLERRLEEHAAEVEKLQEKFQKEFELAANRILDKNTENFQKRSSEQMKTILSPLQEKIVSFEKKVVETHEKGVSERAALKAVVEQLSLQNKNLSEEAQNLTKALKGDVKKQGNWGEVILERILESSGLRKGFEYTTQESFRNDEGRLVQPDVVIHLPDEKYVIVDSKVSLVAYEKLAGAEEAEDIEKALKEHSLSVRAHVKGLSDKAYQKLHKEKSPDFVLLFIPIEGAFNAALQFDNAIYEDALDKNIIIVSPTTLLATLRTIASIWKQEYQNQNIRKIADEGAKLYDKLVGFVEDMQKLGKQMDTTQRTYEGAMKKLSEGSGNLLRRGENMKKLGLQTTKSIDKELLDNDSDNELIE
ncbi:MAG: DNA recombination protein RmuC [Bacteroidetes bacterium]|uniref:DNA recombination protein RmuC n=2 Tax=Phaeocystidibacter marisrubri TaxID=1577780 RepID=A0A6L3ZH86_9FLAO|nr:DNA recombination protein RmuC [Phaeocystidibacter marisrubri]TNE27722.1 MAG: DNA recombination protein RmuC [Bacteroidota bacterium]